MVTADLIGERRALVAESPALQRLLDRLAGRATPVLARMPEVPQVKALLSRQGGFCPEDGAPLVFDPWSPRAHRCSRCGAVASGDRQDRHWAKLQHLWLAERAAHLATVGVMGERPDAIARAREILAAYRTLYFELPNRDNVLGPSHLFFSTYLESLWVLNYLAGAHLLREAGELPPELGESVDAIANEAANVIGEFNEGHSNRQTWHAAALTAIAAWFGDEELARSSIEGRTGLMGHLADGFGEDGTWYEGENYHLFALRGLLTGLGWAGVLGAELLEDEEVAGHLRKALLAPARTALPDLTFPARKDSRFGVSLAQPMYLEMWEIGWGLVGSEDDELAAWLGALYQVPAQPALTLESYLHEAGEPAPATRGRHDLSWWALLGMQPELGSPSPWRAASHFLPSQGLALVRQESRYVSLECGDPGGGHGHPDRLHLTLHDQGVHWLPDLGTGSYVSPDLFWYRSTLAHNAPLVDGRSQPWEPAAAEMFDVQGAWAWMRGRFRDTVRTVVSGPGYLLDVVTFSGDSGRPVELPWHLAGEAEVESEGKWEPVEGPESAFVRKLERFLPDGPGPLVVTGRYGARSCKLHHLFEGELRRATAPGIPGSGDARFFLLRGEGHLVQFVTVIDPGATVTALEREGDVVTVHGSSTDRHTPLLEGWQVETGTETVRLAGPQRQAVNPAPILTRKRIDPVAGTAPWLDAPPPLDGTEAGFDLSEPLELDTEEQYRRSEEPYADPSFFSATGYVNWSDDTLYVLVEVRKEDIQFRSAGAALLDLDNEVEDIHSDGLQVYARLEDEVLGFLVVPDPASSALRVRTASGCAGDPAMVSGQWEATPEGYRVTLAIRTGWQLDARVPLGFDLLVNEMRPERERRAGQLVWSGAHGWVYLRGDRQDPSQFGVLTLG